MKIKKGYWIPSLILLIVLLVGLSKSIYDSLHPTLTICIYTGSSWDVPNSRQYRMINYITKKFKKDYPNVKVAYESGIRKSDYINWLSEKIVNGQAPDVMIIPQENFNVFASEGAFKNITNYVKRENIGHKFYSGALAAGQYNNKQYALPYETNPTILLANQKLLKQNGLTDLNKVQNVNYFRNLCHQISIKKNQYGITSNYNWYDAQLAYGSKLFDDNNHALDLETPKVRAGFNLIEDLNNDSQLHNVTSNMFDQGSVAFMPLNFAQYRTYTSYPYYVTQNSNFAIKTLKMPGKKSTPASTTCFAISSQSRKTGIAWKFIKLVCSDKQVQQKLMQNHWGCSVMPSVIKTKETAKILARDESFKDSISTTQLDAILKDETVEPKFKNYYTVLARLDYQIETALNNGDLASQLFNIQLNINKRIQ